MENYIVKCPAWTGEIEEIIESYSHEDAAEDYVKYFEYSNNQFAVGEDHEIVIVYIKKEGDDIWYKYEVEGEVSYNYYATKIDEK